MARSPQPPRHQGNKSKGVHEPRPTQLSDDWKQQAVSSSIACCQTRRY
ncbi:hypothetical protein PSPO01_15421 [Paraphaeosphaeria sporulosa]